ncbi:MAG: hypothetical protein JF586_10870 [Burkholderiales bacterium]|jgi:hypothetical protein|nr:hypothetical protein [Burkholderiales bacterium]
MLEDTALTQALGAALARLLRPLVRLMLRHSFSYSAFESVAKRVYAECAMQDFALPGRKPSVSRAAVLTGLTRKEVNTLLTEPWSGVNADSTHYNRAARVVTAWVRDARFSGIGGTPRALAMEGADGFSELVRLNGGDVPTRAVLDELVRVGCVRPRPDGKVELVQRGFVPNKSMVAKISFLGSEVADLVETITFNIEQPDAQAARYQRKVMHVGIPSEALPAFRALSGRQAQKLLEGLDAWLAEHDLSGVPEEDWGSTARVGVGIYYFEEIVPAPQPDAMP